MYDLNEFLEAEEINLKVCENTQNDTYELKLCKYISELVKIQKDQSINKHGKFKNNHEFYSVLLEELQETQEEINVIKKQLDNIWQDIRDNKSIDNYLKYIIEHSSNSIFELIQVQAVCLKLKEGFEKK